MRDDLPTLPDRRALLGAGAGAVLISVVPGAACAEAEDVVAAQRALFGSRPIRRGRVTLTLPPIAENGFSVPLTIAVDSPMTPANHVRRLVLFSERNPLPTMASFTLGPRAGRALISTRVRLAASQTLTAVAEMGDGSLWSGTAETVVTLAACVVL